jgi:hypothetical protein
MPPIPGKPPSTPYRPPPAVLRCAEPLRGHLVALELGGWPVGADEVAHAYRLRALATHPDRGGSAADFTRVQAAYEYLRALPAVKNHVPSAGNQADNEPIGGGWGAWGMSGAGFSSVGGGTSANNTAGVDWDAISRAWNRTQWREGRGRIDGEYQWWQDRAARTERYLATGRSPEWVGFVCGDHWHRSSKGNLTGTMGGHRFTVFYRAGWGSTGSYSWCANTAIGGEPLWGRDVYDTELEAVESLATALFG